MGIFDTVLASDARFAFGDVDSIGAEAATYKPRSGSNRAIKVVVNRNIPPEYSPQGVVRYPILVSIQNSSTYGISATELDTGADKIALPFRQGGDAQDYLLGIPEAQDAGMLTFKIYGHTR